MKLHQIALAVAALAAGTASAATVTFTVSGATALNKSFEKTVFDMCDNAFAVNTYSYDGSVSGTKAAVRYECKAKAGLGIAGLNTGDDLVINKEQGGSSSGVKPVSNATTVTVATTACTTSTTTGNVTTHTGCGNSTAVPTAGISDVEPKLLAAAADYANLNNAGIVAQVFGIAVSDNVYQKLQAEQGKIVGDYSEAEAPSLPASFVRGAFSGNANDWTAVDPDITADSDRSGENHPDQAIWDDANPNSTAVKVCRRATGSGTLATFEATVMAQPCATSPVYGGATGLSTYLGDDTNANDGNKGFLGETDVYTVVENSSQENVDTCLTQAYYQGEMAIAIMGTERAPGDTGSKTGGSDDNDGLEDKWHLVKIGQVYPSVANFVAGDYDFYWAEASFNRRKSGYTALETNMMNYFQTKMGDPAAITSIPLPGLAALTSNGYVFDYGVTPVARAARGGNTCQMGIQTY
ncbi:MAG: hypothetical protein AB1593_10105 [Pseudomonadota bacterium]